MWPTLCAVAVSVMTSVGFAAVNSEEKVKEDVAEETKVELKLANSEEVGNALGRDEELVFVKDGLTVRFSRNVRGQLKVCVEGAGYSKEDLEAFGQELAGRVVQQFAYRRIMEEMQKGNMNIVEQSVDEEQNIHIRLRSWEE